LVNKIKVMTKNEILDLIDTLNQYKAGNVTNKGLEEALQSACQQDLKSQSKMKMEQLVQSTVTGMVILNIMVKF